MPPADRSLGNGIFNSGAAVGAVLAPLIVPTLAQAYGWRTAFVVVGSLGFVWVAAWLLVLSGERRTLLALPKPPTSSTDEEWPADYQHFSELARQAFGFVAVVAVLIAVSSYKFGPAALWWAIAWLMFGMLIAALVLPLDSLKGTRWAESLGTIVRFPRFWILVVVSVSINVCWHFLVNWLPTYLQEDRGMTFLKSGLWSAIPFLAADAGNLGGGALSRELTRRGLGAARARIAVMAVCTLLITSGAWVGLVKSDTTVIILLAVMAMATAAFMANYFAFTQDVSPRHTGLIVGILGGLGNLCAAGFLPLAGRVKESTGGFGPIFVLVGLLPFLGLGAVAGWETKQVSTRLPGETKPD